MRSKSPIRLQQQRKLHALSLLCFLLLSLSCSVSGYCLINSHEPISLRVLPPPDIYLHACKVRRYRLTVCVSKCYFLLFVAAFLAIELALLSAHRHTYKRAATTLHRNTETPYTLQYPFCAQHKPLGARLQGHFRLLSLNLCRQLSKNAYLLGAH